MLFKSSAHAITTLKRDSKFDVVEKTLIQSREGERYVMECPLTAISQTFIDQTFPEYIFMVTNQSFMLLTVDYSVIWERSIFDLDFLQRHDVDSHSAFLQYRAPCLQKNGLTHEVQVNPRRRKGVHYLVEPLKKYLLDESDIGDVPCPGVVLVNITLQFLHQEDLEDLYHLFPILVRDAWQVYIEKMFLLRPKMFFAHFFTLIKTGKHADKLRLVVFNSDSLLVFRLKATLIVDCIKWTLKGESINSLSVKDSKCLVTVDAGKSFDFWLTSHNYVDLFIAEVLALSRRSRQGFIVRD
ncbi:hypothetical protein RCL1_004698 [Eukaryota sp. TZLM3-RCL]